LHTRPDKDEFVKEDLNGGISRQDGKEEENRAHKRQWNRKTIKFLWLFSLPLKKTTEFNTSSHTLIPAGFDETTECNTSKKQKL